MNPNEQADELLQNWVNGNRKDAMRALGEMSPMRAAYVASWVTLALDEYGKKDFMRMMERRLD